MADKSFGSSAGLTILAEDQATPANGMVNYITSSFQSGYQNGDIKGAFLSDTDDTDLVYTVLNSTTDYTTEWTQTEDGWTINATSLVCDGVDSLEFAFIDFSNAGIPIAVGDQIAIKLTVSSYSSGDLFISFTNGAESTPSIAANGDYEFVGTVTSNDLIYLRSENFAGTVTNIEISSLDADRSVNNNGLIVNGTVTRTFVDEV